MYVLFYSTPYRYASTNATRSQLHNTREHPASTHAVRKRTTQHNNHITMPSSSSSVLEDPDIAPKLHQSRNARKALLQRLQLALRQQWEVLETRRKLFKSASGKPDGDGEERANGKCAVSSIGTWYLHSDWYWCLSVPR